MKSYRLRTINGKLPEWTAIAENKIPRYLYSVITYIQLHARCMIDSDARYRQYAVYWPLLVVIVNTFI